MKAAELIRQGGLCNGIRVVAPLGLRPDRHGHRPPDGPVARLARGQGMGDLVEKGIPDLGLVIQPNELTGEANRPLVPAADSESEFGIVEGEVPIRKPVLRQQLAGEG